MNADTTTRAPAATLGAADYGRISSDPGHDAKGVARQTQRNRDLISHTPGWHHAGSFVDNDLSASRANVRRPEFERLLDAVRRGEVQIIVCYMSGRLLRNARDRLRVRDLFAEHHVKIVCTDGQDHDYSTPSGRMIAGIMGEVDQHEVEQASQRIRDSKRQAAEEGRPTGSRCYGYRPDPTAPKNAKRRLIVPEEAEVIRWAADAVLAGVSMRRITASLNDAGVKPLYADTWLPATMRDLLANPAIAGRRVYRGKDVGEAGWEPIVKYEKFLRVAGTLDGGTRPDGYSSRVTHLLSGVAVCGRCGAPVVCRTGHVYKGRQFARSYFCPDRERGGCHGLRRPADPADGFVEETVVRMLGEPGVVGSLVAAGAPDAEEVLSVQRGIEAAQARAAALGAEMAGDDPADEVTRIMRKAQADTIRADLDGLRRRQAQMSRSTLADGLLDVADVAAHWRDGMTLSQKRAVLKALVSVTLVPTGRGRKAGIEHIQITRKPLPGAGNAE